MAQHKSEDRSSVARTVLRLRARGFRRVSWEPGPGEYCAWTEPSVWRDELLYVCRWRAFGAPPLPAAEDLAAVVEETRHGPPPRPAPRPVPRPSPEALIAQAYALLNSPTWLNLIRLITLSRQDGFCEIEPKGEPN